MSRIATSQPAVPPGSFDRTIAVGAALICGGLLAFKFALATRLNVNWDEFYYLHFVHAAVRGELDLLLQGAYVHLFSWLTALDGDEMSQVAAARFVMIALLGVTVLLIWQLGRRWLGESEAMIAPFVYLASSPVIVHGGSFRADSMLAPVTMAALVLLTASAPHRRRDWYAGVLLGAAFAITVKVALFAPLVVALMVARPRNPSTAIAGGGRSVMISALELAVAASVTAAILILLHSLTNATVPTESAAEYGARAARKTLLDVPWFARGDFLHRYVVLQPLPWLLMALGTIASLARKRFDLAALALSLLPIAVYRNAFPYYYVVMLAPASVLAGFAVQEIRTFVRQRSGLGMAGTLFVLIWAGLLQQGLIGIARHGQDGQATQRRVVAAVHHVFREPVNYIDRCGMIASFRKVNFFMSTWGLEGYRERKVPFVPEAVRDHKPAFVLINSGTLDPERPKANGLMAEDYALIERFYPRYWGPLRVAGASATLSGADEARLKVPYAAVYRLASPAPILIDGVLRNPGEVISVSDEGVSARLSQPQGEDGITVTLFLAAAQPPPADAPPAPSPFAGL